MDLEHQLVGVKQQQIPGIIADGHIDLPLISGTRRSAIYSSLADGTSGLINVMHARGPNQLITVSTCLPGLI